MFFVASKALWFFAAPSALLMLGALVGAAFSARRGGRSLALGCLAVLLVIGAAPLGALLMRRWRTAFPRRPPTCRRPTASSCSAARSTTR